MAKGCFYVIAGKTGIQPHPGPSGPLPPQE
jgi:hypothetical protein